MLRKLNDMDTLPGCKPVELWPSPGSEASLDMRSWDLTGGIVPKEGVWEYQLPSGKQTNITLENHHFLWVNQLSMAMFKSYVKVPEGI